MSQQPLQIGNVVLLTQDEKRRVDAILDTLHGIRGLKAGNERYVTDEKTRHNRINRLNELGPKQRSLEESKELMHLIVESWYAGKLQHQNGAASNDALGHGMMVLLKGPLMYDLNVAKSLTKIVIDESYITDHDTAGFDVITEPRKEQDCPVCEEREKEKKESSLVYLYQTAVSDKTGVRNVRRSDLWGRVFDTTPGLVKEVMEIVRSNDGNVDYNAIVAIIYNSLSVKSLDDYESDDVPYLATLLEGHMNYLRGL